MTSRSLEFVLAEMLEVISTSNIQGKYNLLADMLHLVRDLEIAAPETCPALWLRAQEKLAPYLSGKDETSRTLRTIWTQGKDRLLQIELKESIEKARAACKQGEDLW